MEKRISFYVKYQEGFTEDLYKKLWNWSVTNSLGLPRGWRDTYERLKQGHFFLFDNWGINEVEFNKDNIKNKLSYGVDNNSQSIKKELSVKEVTELISTPSQLLGETEEWKPKVGDWVVGWHVSGCDYKTKAWKVIVIKGRQAVPQKDWGTTFEHLRLARPEEIPQEEVEYVEVICSWGIVCVTKGKIYTFPNLIDDKGILFELNKDFKRWTRELKPSTREAYEAQEKGQSLIVPKEVNKCSTINTNQNECKNENSKRVITIGKILETPRGERPRGSILPTRIRVYPSAGRRK